MCDVEMLQMQHLDIAFVWDSEGFAVTSAQVNHTAVVTRNTAPIALTGTPKPEHDAGTQQTVAPFAPAAQTATDARISPRTAHPWHRMRNSTTQCSPIASERSF
jgi:hypothetical protein